MSEIVRYPLKLCDSNIVIEMYYNFFDKLGIKYDNNYVYLSSSLLDKIKRINHEDYYYLVEAFPILVGSDDVFEEVELKKIVGSNEYKNINNWVDRLFYGRSSFQNIKEFLNNPDYYSDLRHYSNHEPIKLIEYNGEYYVADGHHRVAIMKFFETAGKEEFKGTLSAYVRHVPKDINFTRKFVNLCENYHLYDQFRDPTDGYISYDSHFQIESFSNGMPVIVHKKSGFIIFNSVDIERFEEQIPKLK